MGRPTSFPAREYTDLRKAWLRRNAQLIVIAAALFLFCGAALTWVVVQLDMPGASYVLGLTHAALAATFWFVLNHLFLAHEPRAVWQLRGSYGEDNTRNELARARKSRIIWDWVDSIDSNGGDIDHVVVTRRGGVVMLDSKFRNGLSATDRDKMAESARLAGVRAQGVVNTVLRRELNVRHRAQARSVTVKPAVVVWGSARTEVPLGAVHKGVQFVDGRRLLEWLGDLEHHEVPRESARQLVELLNDHAESVRRSGSPELKRWPWRWRRTESV